MQVLYSSYVSSSGFKAGSGSERGFGGGSPREARIRGCSPPKTNSLFFAHLESFVNFLANKRKNNIVKP